MASLNFQESIVLILFAQSVGKPRPTRTELVDFDTSLQADFGAKLAAIMDEEGMAQDIRNRSLVLGCRPHMAGNTPAAQIQGRIDKQSGIPRTRPIPIAENLTVQQVAEIETEMRPEDPGTAVHGVAVGGLGPVKARTHTLILRALAWEHEHHRARLGWRLAGNDVRRAAVSQPLRRLGGG